MRAGLLLPLVLTVGCGVLSVEEQVLTDFFHASALHDTTIASRVATADFNPRTHGIVERFAVVQSERGDGGTERVVTLDALVRRPDGVAESRQIQVILRCGDGGRWRVAGWTFTPPRASRTGHAASSAPPT